ncbi:ammonium transporter [Algihabitans sp.]|uniref:ammonium transporter n=1 Tax=Algihabitans sp. TaxID=2821514 RepID=UPI003BAAD4B3
MRCRSGAGLGGAVRESRSLRFGVTTKVERVGAAIHGEGDLVDVLWLIVSAVLVLMMQGGFACLESGLVRAKNTINVVVKNVVDISLTGLLFWLFGFALMFGPSLAGWIGFGGFMPGEDASAWLLAFFLFQLVFCGTAVTIVSGAVAERMRFDGYLIVAALVAGLIYPLYGHWAWGGLVAEGRGWLAEAGFIDFAGSTVVHSIGGWVALAAVLVIGPRLGRYGPDGRPIEGHNLPLSMLGVLLLWVGWFGFNGGSTLALDPSIAGIAVNTVLGPVGGCLLAMAWSWRRRGRPDVRTMMDGILAGLVAITAGAHTFAPASALLVGALGGAACIAAAGLLERLRIDDAVNAVPVHLAAGVWGTLAVALFGDVADFAGATRFEQLGSQLLGVVVAGAFAFTLAFAVLRTIDRVRPLRVSRQDELTGLNVAEHGASSTLTTLLAQMHRQSTSGDFARNVPVDEGSEAGEIAAQYNLVLEKFRMETAKREQAVRAVHKAKEQAESANAAKSNFLASMSHELRTPLNAVIGFSEVMREQTFGPLGSQRYRDYVGDIHGSAKHLLSLINDLLDLSKIEANKYQLCEEELDVGETVETALRLVRPLAERKGLTLTARVPDRDDAFALPLLLADERALHQILLNLLSNACKFTDTGGDVLVSACREPDGRVAIAVQDSGIGMSRAQIRQALEPFVQVDSRTRRTDQGTGLGLPLARSLAELHGGSFVMTSEVGYGTEIVVRFPLHRIVPNTGGDLPTGSGSGDKPADGASAA